MGEAERRWKLTPETRRRMRLAWKKRDPSISKRAGLTMRGRVRSKEHTEALRQAKLDGGYTKGLGAVHVHGRYRYVKVALDRGRRNWEPEHRIIMEKELGRPLVKGEHVHHLDGNALNNSLDNLVLLTGRQHWLLNRMLTDASSDFALVAVLTFMRRFPNLAQKS